MKKFKYTKQRVDIIIQSLKGMSSKAQAAESAGIVFKTFNEWYNEIPEFKELVDKTLEECVDRGRTIAIQAIFKAMDKSWQAGAWWLERNFPEEFALKNRIEGSIDHNIKQLIINVSDDETKKLIEKATNMISSDNDVKLIDKDNNEIEEK